MTQAILNQFLSILTSFKIEIDAPDDPNAEVWIDSSLDSFFTNVSYRPAIGFGVYLETPELGQQPDELHATPSKAAKRIQQLYRSYKNNGTVAPLDLGSIRELYEVTQQQLADALNIQQPSVQRVENRPNIKYDTLLNHITALGGRVETRVVFPDLDARFELPTTHKKCVRTVTAPPPPLETFPALNLVVLQAQDPDKLAAFYECLGATFKDEKHGEGPKHKSSILDGTVFEIYPSNKSTDKRVGFKVPSIKDAMKHLEPYSINPIKTQKSDDEEVCIFQDPEGNYVHLSQPVNN